MKLLSLHIEGFGKFHDLDLTFKDGINVVYGKNEAGKSTLHTFIKGMLFGIERQRGRASKNDVYSKYEPWKGAAYEGFLRLESEGQVYRIQRTFRKQDKKLIIVNETAGKEMELTKALFDQLRCGLSETSYDNTISIGQLKCATDSGMAEELRNYIANLNTSGSTALNISRAASYLKSQIKGLEAQFTPEAAKDYAALLSEIRSTEQEISDPSYANHLIQYRSEYSQLKEKLEQCQNEREGLLEKAAKGRQILEGSQFSDKDSVQEYLDHTRKLYQEYSAIKTAYQKGSRRGWNIFFFFLAFAASMGTALCLTVPRLVLSLLPLPLAPAPAAVAAGTAAAVFLLCAFIQSHKERRLKKEMEKSAQLLQEIFSKHLGDSSISKEAMDALEGRMAEFLRLSKALRQSEDTLARLSQEMKDLKNSQEHFSQEIEEQQRIQWELEQKLEHLSVCREQAERLRRVLTENERIQEELDAIDLAQETITSLSASIRDSFGFYLNKEASDLISGITGGIYTSMSINENLEVFMNTPTKLVPINQVSSGTMDQIYLALRLAAAKLIQNGRSDTMPLIFDDSFVLYDDDRLKTALKWLSRAFKGQIIIFTCHQREAQLLTANQVKYHLIQIDRPGSLT